MGITQQEADERVSYTYNVIATNFGPGSDPTKDIVILEDKLSTLIVDILQKKWGSLYSQIKDHQMNDEPEPVQLQIQFNRIRKLTWQAYRARVARQEREGKKVNDAVRERVQSERKLESDVDEELEILVELYTWKEPTRGDELREKLRQLRCRNMPDKATCLAKTPSKPPRQKTAKKASTDVEGDVLQGCIDQLNAHTLAAKKNLDSRDSLPPQSDYKYCDKHDRWIRGPCPMCREAIADQLEKADQLVSERVGHGLNEALARCAQKDAEKKERDARKLEEVLERFKAEEELRLAVEKLKLNLAPEKTDL